MNSDGEIYVGQWENGAKDGYGIYIYSDHQDTHAYDYCAYFSGYWSGGKKNGVCTGFDEAGKILYSGGYINNVRDDQLDEDIDSYDSIQFISFKRQDGRTYVGESEKGIPEGYGMLIADEGNIWYGEWKNGRATSNGKELLSINDNKMKSQAIALASSAQKVFSDIAKRISGETDSYSEPAEEKSALEALDAMPSFNGGGTTEFTKWVNQNLKYPEKARVKGIQGTVLLSFTIGTKGYVTDIQVISSIYPALDAEAIRVVKESPRWSPGMIKGNPVPVTFSFPVIFTLYDE